MHCLEIHFRPISAQGCTHTPSLEAQDSRDKVTDVKNWLTHSFKFSVQSKLRKLLWVVVIKKYDSFGVMPLLVNVK